MGIINMRESDEAVTLATDQSLDDSASGMRILLIKLRYMGDVVLSTPVLPLLRKHFPDAKITFLVNPGTAGVLQDNPYLNAVWVLPRQSWWQQLRFIQRVRAEKFTTVIDLTDGDRSAFLSWISGASMRLGYNRDRRWRGKFYSRLLSSAYGSMHMVDYHQQAIAALGIAEPVGNPEIYISTQRTEQERLFSDLSLNGRPLVLLHPTARYSIKAWPLERFAAVADWFIDQGYSVALIGSQREFQIGQQIVNLSKQKPMNLMGQTRLSQLTALMKRSHLLVGNDGGPMHIAAAVGCPVLGLFGPTNPAVWGPRGSHVKVIYKGLNCEECFYPGCSRGEESCMRKISVEEVCHAAQSMLPILRES
ncbi:MAG: putative lipopolysaccharide heptosyltransferase III [Nitrospirota bacterium]|nr:putative lipopolysaccharide heptosyltransferase III [Nitrospirota bacterium]